MIRFTHLIRFTQGILVGMEIEQTIPFLSLGAFAEWVAGVNANNEKGECNYRVLCLIKYETPGPKQWANPDQAP